MYGLSGSFQVDVGQTGKQAGRVRDRDVEVEVATVNTCCKTVSVVAVWSSPGSCLCEIPVRKNRRETDSATVHVHVHVRVVPAHVDLLLTSQSRSVHYIYLGTYF